MTTLNPNQTDKDTKTKTKAKSKKKVKKKNDSKTKEVVSNKTIEIKDLVTPVESEKVAEITPAEEPKEVVEQMEVQQPDDGKIECSPCKMASIDKALKLEYIKAGAVSSLLVLGLIAYFVRKGMPLFFDILMTILAYVLLQVTIKIFELRKLKSTLKVRVN